MEDKAAVNPGWRTSSHTSNGGSTCVEVGAIPWRKSSYSGNGGSTCVEVGAIPWRKSSCSSNGGATCVEAGSAPGVVLIRDTTDNGNGLTLHVTPAAWSDFTTRIRANGALS
jgi:hypothetical protein